MTVNKLRFVLLCFLMTSDRVIFLCSGLFLRTSVGSANMCTRRPTRSQGVHRRPVMSRVIGIHLGTTHSRVAAYKHPAAADVDYCRPGNKHCAASSFYDTIEVVKNEQGSTTTPSCVSFTHDSRVLIGEAAKAQEAVYPGRTICGINRLIGRTFDDPEVQSYIKTLSYKVVNKDNKPHIEIEFNDGAIKLFSPEEICAMILGKMKEIAEKYLESEVTIAVILVHERNWKKVRQQIFEACRMAGLKHPHINRSTHAVGLVGGVLKDRQDLRVLIYSLGGTAFNATLLVNDGPDMFSQTAAKGDAHLGGQSFDTRLVDYFVSLIKNKYKKDISNDLNALRKLRIECEEAKISLSSSDRVLIKIELSLVDDDEILVFEETLTRDTFEELNMDLFNRAIDLVKGALEEGGVEKTDIDEMILVGGSSQIPMIQHLLKSYFGKDPLTFVKPKDALLFAATSLAGQIGQHHVPSTIVMNPISVGIETIGGVMTRFMDADNAHLPHTRTRTVTTYHDGQTTIQIKVFEGEQMLTKYCHYLGNLQIFGLPPAPRGVTRVEVTLEVHVDGKILVTAEHKPTQNKKSMIIPGEGRIKGEEKVKQDYWELEKNHKEDMKVWDNISYLLRLYKPQPHSMGFAAVI